MNETHMIKCTHTSIYFFFFGWCVGKKKLECQHKQYLEARIEIIQGNRFACNDYKQ